jgi:hypothetical protein
MKKPSSSWIDYWRTFDCSDRWDDHPSLTRELALTFMGRFESLQVAAYHKDRHVVETILRPVLIQMSGALAMTLHYMQKSMHTDIVRLLIYWKADMRCRGNLGFLLEAAADQGHNHGYV